MSDKNFKLYARCLQLRLVRHEQGRQNQGHPTNVGALEVARLEIILNDLS